LATVGLAAGGATTLVLAAKAGPSSRQRAIARRWGIVAVVMAVVSSPINFLIVGLSGLCVVG